MNSWIPKNKIVKLAISMAFLSILLYIVGFYFVAGQAKKVEDFYNNIESKSFEGNKISAIKFAADTNSGNIQSARSFFVQKGDEVKFIEEIEKAAKDSELKFEISSIDVKNDIEQQFSDNIEVRMQVEGSWDNIFSMLNSLERLPFGVLINDVNLDTSGEGYWTGFINFTVFKEK